MSEHSRPAALPSAQVLIVDDNEDAAMSLVMLLELEDISAFTAPDAETALEMIQNEAPVLILIDIGLPGMNGFELARRLREIESSRNSTLIALTGRETRAGEDNIAGTAFDQYWTKPFDPKKLITEVQAVIDRADSARRSDLDL